MQISRSDLLLKIPSQHSSAGGVCSFFFQALPSEQRIKSFNLICDFIGLIRIWLFLDDARAHEPIYLRVAQPLSQLLVVHK